jgi:hypothetical protein
VSSATGDRNRVNYRFSKVQERNYPAAFKRAAYRMTDVICAFHKIIYLFLLYHMKDRIFQPTTKIVKEPNLPAKASIAQQ